jgi:hypothetical protein
MHSYRNVLVEAEIAQEMQIHPTEARDLFQEMLRFLDGYWLARDRRSPTPAVDLAWHSFIVDTRAYKAYCEARFGTYLHHVPLPEAADPSLARCTVLADPASEPITVTVDRLLAPVG